MLIYLQIIVRYDIRITISGKEMVYCISEMGHKKNNETRPHRDTQGILRASYLKSPQ